MQIIYVFTYTDQTCLWDTALNFQILVKGQFYLYYPIT